MSEEISFQTWICPKCNDDHLQDRQCSPIEDQKMFMPSEKDFSHIANEYRARVSEIEVLKEKLKLAESQIDDLKQQVDELNKAVYQENGED